MTEKIYLIWQSYSTNKYLEIGVLEKNSNGFIFNFSSDVNLAIEEGCLLPFAFSDYPLVFQTMPDFFERRMIKKNMRLKMGISVNNNDDFAVLTSSFGRVNSDNFIVLSKTNYNKLIDNENSKEIKLY